MARRLPDDSGPYTEAQAGRRERVLIGPPPSPGWRRTALQVAALIVVLLIFFMLVAGATGLEL